MKAKIYFLDSESGRPGKVTTIFNPKRSFSSEREAWDWTLSELVPSLGLTASKGPSGRYVTGFKYPDSKGHKSLIIWIMKIFVK